MREAKKYYLFILFIYLFIYLFFCKFLHKIGIMFAKDSQK